MKSFNFRNNSLFLRNEFETSGEWQMPLIKKQMMDLSDIRLISISDTKFNDNAINRKRGVHFFVDDYRFEAAYKNPERTLEKVSQYAFVCTPDFSTYSNMNYWRQLESIAHSRWCGALWQNQGLTVVPTVSWSDVNSFDFCFDAIEKGAVVAVGMIGCKHAKEEFLQGYREMLHRIEPSAIICFGKPFLEMEGNLIIIDYLSSRKVVR